MLCVEDDPSIAEMLRLALGEIGGLQVEVARNGREALERFRRFAPQLVLCDVMMPDMTGPETLRALRGMQGGEAVPVVFLTAVARSGDRGLGGEGVAAVVAKPFDPFGLADEVRAIWRRHQTGER